MRFKWLSPFLFLVCLLAGSAGAWASPFDFTVTIVTNPNKSCCNDNFRLGLCAHSTDDACVCVTNGNLATTCLTANTATSCVFEHAGSGTTVNFLPDGGCNEIATFGGGCHGKTCICGPGCTITSIRVFDLGPCGHTSTQAFVSLLGCTCLSGCMDACSVGGIGRLNWGETPDGFAVFSLFGGDGINGILTFGIAPATTTPEPSTFVMLGSLLVLATLRRALHV